MGYYTDHKKNFTIYDIPKGGGTTIRFCIKYYKTDGSFSIDENKNGYNFNRGNINHLGYKLDWFIPVNGERVCVKRDPIDRFISCYNDKIIRENWMSYGGFRGKPPTLDDFIQNFDTYIKKYDTHHPGSTSNKKLNYLDSHFSPAHKILGDNLDYYDIIFDMNQINTDLKNYLEDKWNIKLPQYHTRKQVNKKTDMSEESLIKLRQMYQKDYDIGWY